MRSWRSPRASYLEKGFDCFNASISRKVEFIHELLQTWNVFLSFRLSYYPRSIERTNIRNRLNCFKCQEFWVKSSTCTFKQRSFDPIRREWSWNLIPQIQLKTKNRWEKFFSCYTQKLISSMKKLGARYGSRYGGSFYCPLGIGFSSCSALRNILIVFRTFL